MRRLPPLNALRVFEVAARTGSYAEAATQLGVTHGAVSRQIAVLEDWLGQRLFTREGRRMVATPMASAFAAEVALLFDRLAVAAEACGRPGARHILRVSAPTSFAMRWLIPRLAQYRADHPHVEVSVTTLRPCSRTCVAASTWRSGAASPASTHGPGIASSRSWRMSTP